MAVAGSKKDYMMLTGVFFATVPVDLYISASVMGFVVVADFLLQGGLGRVARHVMAEGGRALPPDVPPTERRPSTVFSRG
ncbi:hypothetical protein [Martelella sp. HB161492]|uniref:hypothetical protein n=1 Tax=Martelella sp. HB161492 TaxID=2720726 RepID=UPI0015916018|nr:hypothetical protein [Martelella sp. HB161492]